MARRSVLPCLLALGLTLSPALAAGATRAMVVAGLGGTPDYEIRFQREARDAAEALRGAAPDVTLLLGEMVSRERLAAELTELAQRTAPQDTLLLLLIGHGSFDGRDYRFNIPGPDVDDAVLATWLEAVPAATQVVVAATSASGALAAPLEREGRTVVTATRSGGERNVQVFSRYLIRALSDEAADVDKDGGVSLREAFRFADAAVSEHYAERRQMSTEHPRMSDAPPDLLLARLAPVNTAASARPRGAEQQRVQELEAAIATLRAEKSRRDPEEYYGELQRLLLELAMLERGLEAEAPP